MEIIRQGPKGVTEEGRKIATERCIQYREAIQDYLDARKNIPCGLDLQDRFESAKSRIQSLFDAGEEEWNNWKWQVGNQIRDVETLTKIVPLTDEERDQINLVAKEVRWGISPYYASLIDPDDPRCPVRMQSIPSIQEALDPSVVTEPETILYNSPAPCITRLYPDRLIINVTNACSMFCRHCLRRRDIGFQNVLYAKDSIKEAITYIQQNTEIRDVLLTGGDALMVSDDYLDWILSELDTIDHVEIKRIGTRTPVVLPMRITDELCAMLEKHGTIYLNTQFNHSREITEASARAVEKLTKSGIQVGNQTVLLKGINDDKHVMKKLMQDSLKIRVRPYYIFHCKKLEGIRHFRAHIEDGLNIMEYLRGYTSGMAVPTYIITAPAGRGKTPVSPNYILNTNVDGQVLFRTWGGHVMKYDNER
jgi:lysine 2,3-aminomutase